MEEYKDPPGMIVWVIIMIMLSCVSCIEQVADNNKIVNKNGKEYVQIRDKNENVYLEIPRLWKTQKTKKTP